MSSALALTLLAVTALRAGVVWRRASALGALMGVLMGAGGARAADGPEASPMCPPSFHAQEAGRVLEAHATACADWPVQPVAAATAAAQAPEQVEPTSSGEPEQASPVGSVAGVSHSARRGWSDTGVGEVTNWRQLPGFKVVALLKFQGGGLILTDSGSQYFLKFHGIKGVRMGVKLAF